MRSNVDASHVLYIGLRIFWCRIFEFAFEVVLSRKREYKEVNVTIIRHQLTRPQQRNFWLASFSALQKYNVLIARDLVCLSLRRGKYILIKCFPLFFSKQQANFFQSGENVSMVIVSFPDICYIKSRRFVSVCVFTYFPNGKNNMENCLSLCIYSIGKGDSKCMYKNSVYRDNSLKKKFSGFTQMFQS